MGLLLRKTRCPERTICMAELASQAGGFPESEYGRQFFVLAVKEGREAWQGEGCCVEMSVIPSASGRGKGVS